MAYRILLLSALLLFIFRGEAQTGSISGSISDEQTKSPVRNVTVNLPEGKGS